VSQKKTRKLFLSELLQIYTSFDNFRQKDGKDMLKVCEEHSLSTSPNSLLNRWPFRL